MNICGLEVPVFGFAFWQPPKEVWGSLPLKSEGVAPLNKSEGFAFPPRIEGSAGCTLHGAVPTGGGLNKFPGGSTLIGGPKNILMTLRARNSVGGGIPWMPSASASSPVGASAK